MKISEIKTSNIIRVADIESLFQRPVNYDDIKADILQHGIQELIVVNTKNELLCGYTSDCCIDNEIIAMLQGIHVA